MENKQEVDVWVLFKLVLNFFKESCCENDKQWQGINSWWWVFVKVVKINIWILDVGEFFLFYCESNEWIYVAPN